MRDHLYPQSHLNKTHARILTQQDRLHRLAAGFHGRASLSRALRCLLASVQILMPTLAAALPADGTVVGGRATIQLSTGKALTIQQTTDKAILNWKSFSIGQGESVQFVQPSASSVALNRVLGTDPSIILGRLQANGRLVLLNPNGVLFGAGSQINVGGLLATTLQIRDSDFMAGHYLFAQDPLKTLGTVVNRGAIQISDHGFVFLVAPGVSNEGLIVANLGQVVLGSGRQFTMDMMGDGLINYAIDGKVLSRLTGMDGAPLASAVGNSGTIIAGGGQVILSAKASGEVFSSVVNQSGVIRARSLAGEGGIVRLEGSDPVTNTGRIGWKTNLGQVKHADGIVLHTGEIDVSAAQPGASQGQVTITGETVRLSGNILARGTDGSQGGRILIASTKNTVATTDSVVDASGAGHSSAGNVVVWSDRDTRFNGNILARGGDQSGNGGQVEVSGHERLGFNGHVNALAPNGMTGSLLLDPLSITVATGGAATLAQVDQFGDTPAANQTIDSATINAAAANVTLQANADVTVSNPISMTNNGVGISMQAGRNINVNAAVTTNNGNISLSANDSNAISANRTAGAGGITFGAAGSLSAGSGDIALSVGSSSTAPFNPGAITTVRNLTTTTGNIAITSPNGVSLSGIVNAGSGTISINANTDGAGAQGLTMNAGSSIATTNSGGNAVQLVVNSPAGGTGTAALRGSISTGGGGTTLITTRGQTGAGGNITGGAITQGAVLTVDTGASGTIDLATGDPAAGITLNTAGNDFIGAIGVSRAFNVALRDANALILGPSTISGTLAVTTAGPLTQSGALAVTGTTTLAAGAANNITLTDAGNAFSTVAITSGNNVALTDATALALAASTVSGTLGVTTNGALTQTGVVTVTGATTLAAGSANDINLGTAANNFSTVTVTSGNNVALRDTNALILGPSTVGGTLGVTTGGALTQSGALSVTGATTFTATVANTDVLLGTQANTFSGPLGFAGTLTNFRDVQLRNVNAAATVPVLAGLTNLRNLTLTHDNAAVALPALTLAAGGTLTVTAGGAITDSGALVIPGTTTLTAGANPITLDNANNFTGAVSVPSAAAVTLNDINALALGPSTIAGPLTVTTGGALTQSSALAVTGTTTLAAGAANNITLTNAGNTLNTVAISSGNNVALRDANALILGPSTVNGTLAVTTAGALTQTGPVTVTGATTLAAGAANDISLPHAANNFTSVAITSGNNVTLRDANGLVLGVSTISGGLDITTGGALTQTGPLAVAGSTTLAMGAANNITLTNAGNTLNTVAISSGNNVALRDANALILGPSTISGTLAVTTAGPLTQSGALAVTGTTTLAAGAANNITLTDAGNAFSTVAITSGNNVALTDATALALAASTVSGTLGVTTNGALTQTGVVTVTGATTLAAGSANDINLGTAANNFSTVTVTSGNNVALRDTNALILGPSTVGGTLGVTTGGALTQSGALSVTGATTFTATVANTDVLLGTQANTFSGPLGFAGTLTNFRDVQLRNVNAAATVPVLAGLTNLRNLTLTHDNAAVALPALTLAAGGTLTVTAGGAITDSGALVIPGTTTLTAGANPITLDNANNFTGAVSVPSAAAVTLNDINALALGPSTIAGPLTVTTGGALTQSGALSVTGATTFTATATNSDVFLGTQVNNFGGALAFAGTQANFRDVSLRNVNAGATVPALAGLTNLRNLTLTFNNASIALPPTVLKAGGNLSVTAGGTITDSGNLVVPGTTTLTAGAANNITLDNANNFTGAVSILTGNNVMLNDINALNLGTSTISGTLGVTTNGALTQSGALTITGATTLTAGAANNITLNNAANNFSTVGITSANNVVLTDANALNLATSTISGSLNVTAGSLISQSGALTVAGAASFDTTAAGAMGSVTLTNGNALAFNTSTVGGNLTAATTAGDLTLPAGQTLTVAGDATLTPAGNVNLLGTTRIGGTQSSVGSAGASFVLGTDTNLNALPLPGTGPITVTTTGTTATFTGPALLPSAIMLNNAGNHFSGPVSVTTATSAFTGTITNTYHLTQSAPVTLNVGQNLTVTDLGGTTGTRGNITLPNTGNSFETVNFTGGNITWAETGPVTIGSVSANAGATSAGTLGITATGPITQTGMMTVAGATVLAAGPANNITLNNAANNFSTVGIASGNNVSLTDANALTLSASTVNGNISVSASDLTIGGALTSSGGILNLNATNSVTQLANLATDGPNTVTVSTSGGPIAMLATAMSTTGAGAIIYSAGTDVTLGSLTTGGAVNVAANNGSVMSAPGSGVNVSAGGNSTLQAFNGVVGTQISPLQVNVNAGMLSIRAATAVSGISAFVTGRVSPGNSLSLLNAPPGLVCFNGCYVPATSPTAGFMGFVPSFNRDSVIPSYLYEPTGPNMIAVISTYLPETIVAETPIDIGSDEPSVAREIPPCFPINACRTGSTLLTAPAEDKDADATAR